MKRVWNKKLNSIVWVLSIFILVMGLVNIQALKIRVYPLFREIQHEFILYNTKDYKTVETKHFVIRYKPEDEDIIGLVAKAAEVDYMAVCNMFNYYPKDKTIIIVYDDSKELMKNTNLKQGKPPMGVYFASTIQILSPRLWISEDENMEEIFMNEGPMVHEFSHLLIDDLTNGNYPLWFTEGMALYQEYVQTGYEWGKDLTYDGKPYTLEQLNDEFHDLDEILAYKRSFEITRSLIETYGFSDVNRVLRDLGNGEKFENVHKEIFGKDFEKIYNR